VQKLRSDPDTRQRLSLAFGFRVFPPFRGKTLNGMVGDVGYLHYEKRQLSGLPKVREQTATPRITNVDPLPARMARKLYDQRQDDIESIRRFIAAQPKDAR
jgi:hypothetical protein